jgi:hypothetical protein
LRLVRDGVTWRGAGPPECNDNRFFEGELESCINGQVAMAGAYFRQEVGGLIARLLGEQLPDGGWNCEAPHNSGRSSFNTTICVLEALLVYEHKTGGSPQVTEARLRGQEYLLARQLFRRWSTGEVIARDRKDGADWTRFSFPGWWHYNMVELVVSRRGEDGRWPLDVRYPGVMPIELEESEGQPSRWITLRALRVLDWYEARD